MSSIVADASGSNTPTTDAEIAAVRARGLSGASGVIATSDGGYGVSATSTSNAAIGATSLSGPGAILTSRKATAVIVVTGDMLAEYLEELLSWRSGHAIAAATDAPNAASLFASSANGPGVSTSSMSGAGVIAQSTSGPGISATSSSGPGAHVSSDQRSGIIVSTSSTLPPSPSSLLGAAANALEQSLESAGHAILATTNIQDAAGLYTQSLTGTGGVVSGSKVGLDASSSNGIAVRAHIDSGVGLRVEGSLQSFKGYSHRLKRRNLFVQGIARQASLFPGTPRVKNRPFRRRVQTRHVLAHYLRTAAAKSPYFSTMTPRPFSGILLISEVYSVSFESAVHVCSGPLFLVVPLS
jgi:hypothetical protein